MDQAAKLFGLHELAVEDAARAHQRPKMEDYEGSFFIVLKTARYHDETEEVHFGEIDIFLGARLRRRRPPRRGHRAAQRPQAARGAAGPSEAGAGLGRLGDRRQGRRRLHAGGGRHRRRHRGGRAGRLRHRVRADPARLLPQARGDRVPPRGLPAPGAARGDRARRLPEYRRPAAPLPARRRRPRPPRRRDDQLPARAADQRPRGEPGAGQRPPERGREEDLRLRGPDRGPDLHGQHLGHELRAHARARLAGQLPARAAGDGAGRGASRTASCAGPAGSRPRPLSPAAALGAA